MQDKLSLIHHDCGNVVITFRRMQAACEIYGLGGSEIVGEQGQAAVVARQLSPELGEPLMLQLADSFGS